MKSIFLLALAATAALLSSCHGSPNTDAAANNSSTDAANGSDAAGNASAAATATPLPPAIAKTTSYRCAKAGVISVDFMADNTTAQLHPTPDGPAVTLTAPAAGEAFTGNGYTLSGSGGTVSYTAPGQAKDSCES